MQNRNFESGDQSGDLKNRDSKSVYFPRVNTNKQEHYLWVCPLSRDLVWQNG